MISNDTPKKAEAEQSKKDLYYRQMELLKTFLDHGTITKAQYEKSSHDLTEKMGMTAVKRSD